MTRSNVRRLTLALLVLGLAALSAGPYAASADGPASVVVASADDTSFPAVTAVVLIDQDGRPLASIPAGAVTAVEDGQPAAVVSVVPAASATIPLELVLTMDTSGSMAGGTLAQAQRAATGLIANLQPGDRAALISFDNEVRVDQASTADLAAASAGVARLTAHGNTALYDAVAKSAQVAGQAVNPRRAVVLLTDGEDYGGLSKLSRDQSIASAVDSHTIFYVIGVGPEVDSAYLQQLAQASGGRYFQAAQSSDLATIYATIDERLRSYFVLTLRSTAPAADTARSVKVTVQLGASQASATLNYASKRPPAAAAAATPAATPNPSPPPAPPSHTESSGDSMLGTVAIAAAVLAVPLFALGLLLFSNKRRRAVAVADPDVERLTGPLDARTAGEARDGTPQFRLVASQAGATSRVDLNGAVSIGSSPDSDIVFSGEGVAHHHARLWARDGKVMVHHLAAGYETLVAGEPVDWAPLAAGSEVRVGSGTLVIERVPQGAAPTAR